MLAVSVRSVTLTLSCSLYLSFLCKLSTCAIIFLIKWLNTDFSVSSHPSISIISSTIISSIIKLSILKLRHVWLRSHNIWVILLAISLSILIIWLILGPSFLRIGTISHVGLIELDIVMIHIILIVTHILPISSIKVNIISHIIAITPHSITFTTVLVSSIIIQRWFLVWILVLALASLEPSLTSLHSFNVTVVTLSI